MRGFSCLREIAGLLPAFFELDRFGLKGRIGNHPIVQGLLPELLETAFRVANFPTLSPLRADDLPTGCLLQIGQQRQHFMGGPALVQRLDQGLDDRHRSVVGLRIAPRFQVMGLGKVPVALMRGLIDKQAVMNTEGDLLQMINKVEIRWRGVNRVAAEDDQKLNPPMLHVLHEFPQRLRPIARPGTRGNRIGHGLTDVAQVFVEHVCQQVDDRGLTIPGQHQASTAIGFEVLGHCDNPFFKRGGRLAPGRHTKPRGYRPRQPFDLPSPHGQPMVGLGARATYGGFNHIQSIHSRMAASCSAVRTRRRVMKSAA